jgi:soluble lytic murein transglycosylase-like protein
LSSKRAISLAILFAVALPASAAVRVLFKDGKRIIYNDGVGETTHEALRKSDAWLAARVLLPSLYDDLIAESARRAAVDPRLVKSVMLVESAFNPAAISPKGARGLMQLMPGTAARLGVENSFDPAENIDGGVRHLSYLLGMFGGNLEKSLAAYNAGENAVLRHGGVPPYDETRLYVHKALTAYYGKATLEGGFGRPLGETWRPAVSRPAATRPVRVVRGPRNRVLLTTAPVRSPLRRLG